MIILWTIVYFIIMKALLLFLIIGIIGVECSIYYVIPSELHRPKRKMRNKNGLKKII